MDTKIAAIENARKEAYGTLTEQLRSLNTAQLQLQSEASKLSTALRSTTYAGSWGELQLRRVVEMADMLPYCDFTEQETAGALRADLVVRLPGDHRIVVDAKAPLDAYRAAGETTDETVRTAKLVEHAAKVRGHIDALGAKNYWEQFQPAPEFVVLFLPGDHFLTAALQADRTLMDRALTKRVLLATPTTLIALLKAASYGWRQEAVSKNAEIIATLGRELYDRVSTFAEHIENVGTGLKSALGHYNKAVGSYEGTLLPGARKLAELGAKGAKDLPAPAQIEIAPARSHQAFLSPMDEAPLTSQATGRSCRPRWPVKKCRTSSPTRSTSNSPTAPTRSASAARSRTKAPTPSVPTPPPRPSR